MIDFTVFSAFYLKVNAVNGLIMCLLLNHFKIPTYIEKSKYSITLNFSRSLGIIQYSADISLLLSLI